MGLGSEIKDFVSAFSVGANLVAKSEDRRYRRERDEENDLFRRGYDSREQRDADREFQRRGRDLAATPGSDAPSGRRSAIPPRSSGSSGGDAAARERFDYWRSKGYSAEAAAGIVGNMAQESNFNSSVVGDKGTSFGEYQHRGPRWQALRQYAQTQGKDPSDWRVQADFADHEMRTSHPKAFAALQRARTPQEAADAFALHFERPAGAQTGNANNIHGINNRRNYAAKAFSWASQNAGAPAPAGTRVASATPGQTTNDASPPSAYNPGGYEDETGDEEALEFAEGGAVDPNYGAPRRFTQAVTDVAPSGERFVARRVGDAPRSMIPPRVSVHDAPPSRPSTPAPGTAAPQTPGSTAQLPAWGNYDPDTFAVRPQVMDKSTKQMVDPRSYVDELGEFKGVYTTAPVMGDVDPNSAQGKFRAAQQLRYDRYVAAKSKYDTDLQDARWRDAAEIEAKRRAALRQPQTPAFVDRWSSPPDSGGGNSEGGFGMSDAGHHGGFDGGGGGWGGGADGGGYSVGSGGGDTGTGGLYRRGGLVQKFADGGVVEDEDMPPPPSADDITREIASVEPSRAVPREHTRSPPARAPADANDTPDAARKRLQERQRAYMDLAGPDPAAVTRDLADAPVESRPDEAARGRSSSPALGGFSARIAQGQRGVRVPSPPPVPAATDDPELRAREPEGPPAPAVAGPPRDVMGLAQGHAAIAEQPPAGMEGDPRLAGVRRRAIPRRMENDPRLAGMRDAVDAPVIKPDGVIGRMVRRFRDGPPSANAAVDPTGPLRDRERQASMMGGDANAGHPEPPRRPNNQIATDPARISRAVGEGMKRIQEEFFGTNFDFASGTFPGERNVGQRAFNANAGAPSQEEMNAAFKKVDPRNVLSREDQMVKLLEDQRDFWLSQNRPERAQAATASILLYGRKIAQKAGLMAIAAADDGDINAAARFIQRAYEHIPDGKGLTFTPLGDGRIEYNITTTEDPVGKPRVASLQEVRTLATQLANGSAWAQQMFATARPGLRATAGGATQARPRAPTQKDRDRAAADTEEQGRLDQMTQEADRIAATEPQRANELRSQVKHAPLDRAYNANRRKTPPPRDKADKALDEVEGMTPERKTLAGDLAETILGANNVSPKIAARMAMDLLKPETKLYRSGDKIRIPKYAPFYMTWTALNQIASARKTTGAKPATQPQVATTE